MCSQPESTCGLAPAAKALDPTRLEERQQELLLLIQRPHSRSPAVSARAGAAGCCAALHGTSASARGMRDSLNAGCSGGSRDQHAPAGPGEGRPSAALTGLKWCRRFAPALACVQSTQLKGRSTRSPRYGWIGPGKVWVWQGAVLSGATDGLPRLKATLLRASPRQAGLPAVLPSPATMDSRGGPN